jgi:hypothetical protein
MLRMLAVGIKVGGVAFGFELGDFIDLVGEVKDAPLFLAPGDATQQCGWMCHS